MRKNNPLDNVNRIVDEMEQAETNKNADILKIIGLRLHEIGKESGAAILGLALLQKRAADMRMIEEIIREIEEQQIARLKKALEEAAKGTYTTTRDTLKEAAKAGNQRAAEALKAVPPIRDNTEIKNIVNDVVQQATESFKAEYQTQAFMLRDPIAPDVLIPTKPSEAYQKAIDRAAAYITNSATIYKKTEHAKNYTTIIRETVNELVNSGLRVIHYGEDGTRTNRVPYVSKRLKYHTQRIDTAVRRNVLDSVRDVNQKVQKKIGEQFGADGVEITVHEYPAPDHALIQGHQFTKNEFENMQSEHDFKDVQGRHYIGIRRAIGMWNCRHFAWSILVGVFPPTYTDAQLQAVLDRNNQGYDLPNGKHLTMYECTQKQRAYETKIRYAKDGKITADAVGDKDLQKKYQARVVQLMNEYSAFSAACKLRPKYNRIFVKGYSSKTT